MMKFMGEHSLERCPLVGAESSTGRIDCQENHPWFRCIPKMPLLRYDMGACSDDHIEGTQRHQGSHFSPGFQQAGLQPVSMMDERTSRINEMETGGRHCTTLRGYGWLETDRDSGASTRLQASPSVHLSPGNSCHADRPFNNERRGLRLRAPKIACTQKSQRVVSMTLRGSPYAAEL